MIRSMSASDRTHVMPPAADDRSLYTDSAVPLTRYFTVLRLLDFSHNVHQTLRRIYLFGSNSITYNDTNDKMKQ